MPISRTVRLMLSSDGEPHTPIEAELDGERYRELTLREGEQVFLTPRLLTPRRPRVFEAVEAVPV